MFRYVIILRLIWDACQSFGNVKLVDHIFFRCLSKTLKSKKKKNVDMMEFIFSEFYLDVLRKICILQTCLWKIKNNKVLHCGRGWKFSIKQTFRKSVLGVKSLNLNSRYFFYVKHWKIDSRNRIRIFVSIKVRLRAFFKCIRSYIAF